MLESPATIATHALTYPAGGRYKKFMNVFVNIGTSTVSALQKQNYEETP
jgi:hypothetical protein